MICSSSSPPSETVLAAFGCSSHPVIITGGQNQNYRSDNIVLKPAVDNDETNWIADFYNTIDIPDLRLPQPVKSSENKYVYNGWQAWEYCDGKHKFSDWHQIIELCIKFHQGIEHIPKPDYFQKRDQNPWVQADKAVWGEIEFNFHPFLQPVIKRLKSRLEPVKCSSQLIHGDFGGNVLFSETESPLVIDFSPYWRPVGLSIGVIIVDAVVWNNSGIELVEKYSRESLLQFILRAELRRVIELDRLYTLYGVNKLKEIEQHSELIDFLCS